MYSKVFKTDSTIEERMDSSSMAQVENLCSKCQYLNRATGTSCDAFPEGIPIEIILGEFDHTFEYDQGGVDDSGVTFTPFDKLP